MKTDPFRLRFEHGLTPNVGERSPTYQDTLTNARIRNNSLVPPEAIEQIYTPMTVTWPYPMVFYGYEALGELWFSSASISVNGTPITVYNSTNPTVVYAIPLGGAWQCVIFGTNWIATNGSCYVFQLAGNYLGRTLGFACSNLGVSWALDRLFLWGLNFTTVPAALQTQILAAWQGAEGRHLSYAGQALDQSWVIASPTQAGSSDYPAMLLLALIGAYGATLQTQLTEMMLSSIRSGGLSLIPFDPKNRPVRVLPFGNARAVVYGQQKVSVINDAKVLSVNELARQGLNYRHSVCDGGGHHVFVDSTGQVCMTLPSEVSDTLFVQTVGYEDTVGLLAGGDLIISCDPKEREYYFSNASGCYLLSQGEMSRLTNRPTSLIRRNGALKGAYIEGDPGFVVQSRPIHNEVSGSKALDFVEVQSQNVTGFQGCVHSFYAGIPALVSSWMPVLSDGTISLMQGGYKFAVELKGTWATGGCVEGYTGHLRYTDNALVRGPRQTGQ